MVVGRVFELVEFVFGCVFDILVIVICKNIGVVDINIFFVMVLILIVLNFLSCVLIRFFGYVEMEFFVLGLKKLIRKNGILFFYGMCL